MVEGGLVVLGSTGSIGRQTLDVVRAFPGRFRVLGLAAGRNSDLLRQQVEEFQPPMVYSADPSLADELRGRGLLVPMEEMVCHPDARLVMVGTVGRVGLRPTVRALEGGRTVCLANKEVIIMAGEIISGLSSRNGAALLPVDSEPSAIWQCLRGEPKSVRRIIITASGGPFRSRLHEDLSSVTPEEALNHPTWRMGRRITVDSSTLMNKGFEVIEAHWLFDMPWERIDVVVHPQSLIHSMVEFDDGSVKAQIGPPDMKLPIQYAMFYPERYANDDIPKLDITAPLSMTFEPMDPNLYPCFPLALEAGRRGGTFPAVLCAADEVAVEQFLDGRIRFTDIPRIVEGALDRHGGGPAATLEDVLDADAWARRTARQLVEAL